MNQLATIWKYLYRVQQELKQGTLDTQDIAITALYDDLAELSSVLFPFFLYPQLVDVFTFYCSHVLPHLGISADDQQIVRKSFAEMIDRLKLQEQIAKNFENRFKHFFLQLKLGMFTKVEEIILELDSIVVSSEMYRKRPHLRQSSRQDACASRELEKKYRNLRRAPFTSVHVIPFFEALFTTFSQAEKEAFARIDALFWYQLNELLQMKAVLVYTKTRDVLITHLNVITSLRSKGFDRIDFENRVDESMYQSCWNALQAARAFLDNHFPEILKDRSLQVTCRFPNPMAEYNDTSASLLVGLKVLGDALEMESDPHSLVSGEVDDSGKIRSVTCVPEKILAAEKDPDIHQIYIPSDRLIVESRGVIVIGVRNFSETVKWYYGELLQKKLKQLSRRKMLKSAVSLTAVPVVPFVFSAFRNIFNHPVTEHDIQLLECAGELYQKKSDYRSATTILQALLDRFQQDNSLTEVIQLKAYVLGALGLIYLQQHHIENSLSAFRKAFELWKSIHDREHQADILLRLGGVYGYTVAMEGIKNNAKLGLQCYDQVRALLKPSMKSFRKLQGRVDVSIGEMYYWLDKSERAAKYTRQGVEILDEPESNWVYQTCKQHLGRALTKIGEYDKAYDLLESTSQAEILQSPYYQVRSLWSLSELFLSIEDQNQGGEFAERAKKLCQEYELQGQQRIITHILQKHGLNDTTC